MSCTSGYDEGMLRAYLDRELSARQQEELGRHLGECQSCSLTLDQLESDRALASTSMRALDPAPGRVPTASLAYARMTSGRARPRKEDGIPSRLFAWLAAAPRALPSAAVVAFALAAALAFTPLGTAAQDFIAVFRAQNIQTIKVSPDTLKQIPNANDLGTLDMGAEPEVAVVTSAEAAREAGFAVQTPQRLPADFAKKAVVTYWKPMTATYTYDGAKLAAFWQKKALAGQPPAELAGLVVKAQMPATVVQFHGDADTVESVGAAIANQGSGQPEPTPTNKSPRMIVIAQNRGPQIEVPSGTDVAKLRQEMLDRGALPQELSTQLAAITDWQTTVPVPVVNGESREITVNGVKGVLVTPKSSEGQPGAGVIWQKGGIWYWAFGTVTETELLAAVNSVG
jgi:hypothetical protein